ncbi:hypothetical protein NUACC21_43250 [Scytonema sp. NUACC21]
MTTQDSFFFRLVTKSLKYFLLVMFGFAIAYVFSGIFGATHLAAVLLPTVFTGFVRVGIALLCLIAVVIFIESLR